jgi:hypothetical protein
VSREYRMPEGNIISSPMSGLIKFHSTCIDTG